MPDILDARQYIVDLYNSYSAIAERVPSVRREAIHVKTALDSRILEWINNGKDVVLTGSPGDGKTHVIKWLRNALPASVYTEEDASQRETPDILVRWREQKRQGQPFVIAINHAPLRSITAQAGSFSELSYLTALPHEIDRTTFYNEFSESTLENTIVVDLSRRELLTKEIIQDFAIKLANLALSERCADCKPPVSCPVEFNANALLEPVVIESLSFLLSLVAQRGTHATMRDLTGMLAFILTAGKTCDTRWAIVEDEEGYKRQPSFEDYTYYNLLFEGRSPLFNAVRDFDPAYLADPKHDLELWNGEIQDGWVFSKPSAPATIAELRRLKRRYLFEHTHDKEGQLQRILPDSTSTFHQIVTGKMNQRTATEHLIEQINRLYAPQQGQSDYALRLRLWNSHRYAIGEAPSYVAMRSLPSDKLTIYYPQLALHLEQAIDLRQDHVLLGVERYQSGDPALRIDWPMYQALAAAQKGLPIALQPFHILRRLDLFLRSLGQDGGGPRDMETIEWSTQRRRTETTSVRVSRSQRAYG